MPNIIFKNENEKPKSLAQSCSLIHFKQATVCAQVGVNFVNSFRDMTSESQLKCRTLESEKQLRKDFAANRVFLHKNNYFCSAPV